MVDGGVLSRDLEILLVLEVGMYIYLKETSTNERKKERLTRSTHDNNRTARL